MMASPIENAGVEQRLRACVRDLVAMSAMPAWWIGRSPDQIANSLRDLLQEVLDVDSVSVELRDAETGQPFGSEPGREGTVPLAADRLPPTSVPIGMGGELGRLTVGASRADFPSDLDFLMLQLAANQVAVSFQQALLLRRREQAEQLARLRAEQQSAAVRLGLRALTGLALDPLFQEAVEVVQATLHVDAATIMELEEDRQTLLVRAGVGLPPGLVGRTIPAGESSHAAYCLAAGEPVVVGDLRGETRFPSPPLPRSLDMASGVTVIIHNRSDPFGVLSVHSRRPNLFTRDDVQFLQLTANLLGAALQRSRAEAERETLLARALEARQEAESASRGKSEFLAAMSHELRTPLNAIVGYTELMELEIHGPITEAQRHDLACIKRSQSYLLGLINNVLTFMKLGAGNVQFELTRVSIDGMLDVVEEMIRPQMAAKGLTYEHRVARPGIFAQADEGKLQQILLNLLSNATKFTDAGGSVRLDCAVDDHLVTLRVTDTGCGIAEADVASVFEPFVQVAGDTARNREGTGLGLAISRDFAVGMGGDIRLQSEPGKGSVFSVLVPVGG